MTEPQIRDCLCKLILLEQKVGARVGYSFFETPPSFNSYGSDALNEVARAMARFTGILTPIAVSATSHPKDKAGHIELSHKQELIFIEIAKDILEFPQSILATLAHEISHLFLFTYGISCGDGLAFHFHNEILTDIAAVFLGFGKLMVNGCTSQQSFQRAFGIETQTKTVGYLELEQLLFVYLLVCAMRDIPATRYESELLPGVLEKIRQCRSKYFSDFFATDYHRENTRDALVTKFTLLKRICTDISDLRIPDHTFSYDPALRFLMNVSGNWEIRSAIGNLNRCLTKINQPARIACEPISGIPGSNGPKSNPRRRSWIGSLLKRSKSRVA